MSIKNILMPFALALISTWAIQHFVINRFFSPIEKNTTEFVAPLVQENQKPLLTTVTLEGKRSVPVEEFIIETDWALLTFSTQGAMVSRLEFKRTIDSQDNLITTIHPICYDVPSMGAFLIALPDKTPLMSNVIGKKEQENSIELDFLISTSMGPIKKRFVVYKHKQQVDLQIDLNELKSPIEQLRILLPAPIIPDIYNDQLAAVLASCQGKFEKINRTSLNPDRGWFAPTIFGTEDKYFVHALFRDNDQFVQRAYFIHTEDEKIVSVLEGPTSYNELKKYNLSFYLGPKEMTAIAAVDERLEQVLDYYGWYSPIAKLLLAILNWLYKYLHNYGFAIIVLTFVMKLMMMPFTMQPDNGAKQRVDAQKKLVYIQQKYKDDPAGLERERTEFLKRNGLPGMSGCLVMFIQIPVFFVLSRILSYSIELYRAPMLWIPDLSAHDPYYILPALVMSSMLLSMLTLDSKQRLPSFVMAIIFGVLSATFAAGLSLYIVTNTMFTLGQNYISRLLGFSK